MLTSGAIFELKIQRNAFAAGASTRTPLGKLTALVFRDCFAAEERRGGKERGGEKMGGERSPTSFLHFNHCIHVVSYEY